ncbi:MAG TPA: glycosyltransferase family 39 protein [Candidatus Baltobacteraceae bacterium]
MSARSIPLIAGVAAFLVHLVANPHYGFFRDELYFIICGLHPQLGYVDQPPVVPLLAAMTQLFGHSLILLRAVPALFAGACVYVTCLLVAEFGAASFAQILAALVVFFTGVLMSFGTKLSPDTVGLVTWPLLALIVVRLSNGADPRLWLAAGLVAGISIESKYSVVFFIAALALGLLLTPQRRLLFSRWAAGGALLAALIALPNFLWQWSYGFPMLALLEAGQNGKNVNVSPLLYLAQEAIITGVVLAVVWIAGLVWLLRTANFRFLGYAYLLLIAEMMIFHGKHYYPADVYPILIAAGAVVCERWTRASRIARYAAVAVVLIVGIALAPMALPVLPEATFVRYSASLSGALHISQTATQTERGRDEGALPGDWADMHGWPELAQTVKRVYEALPPSDRAQAVVLGDNYGGASAVEFFAPGIPVISVHNQYWLWGTRRYSGNVLVQMGGTCFASDHLYTSRTVVTTFHSRWAITSEQHLPIAVCRGIRKPLADVWKTSRAYI